MPAQLVASAAEALLIRPSEGPRPLLLCFSYSALPLPGTPKRGPISRESSAICAMNPSLVQQLDAADSLLNGIYAHSSFGIAGPVIVIGLFFKGPVVL